MTRFSKIKVAYELSQLVTILALGCWPAGTRPIMFLVAARSERNYSSCPFVSFFFNLLLSANERTEA